MGLVDIAVQMRGLMVMNKSLFVGKKYVFKENSIFSFQKATLSSREQL
jgi:hypothetical protein